MNEQISQAEARKRILRYNLQKSIDKSGDAMTTPGLLLGGITGAGIGARRGNLRGALAGAAIGAPLGAVGLRMAGRLDEKRRLAGLLQPTEKKLSANLKPALRELAARSGRIVEFGDGEADEAVIAALKAAASADETPAQRAMLLKRGLIQMVKGQLVINERGYDMMKKAGVPPKLTPEERREEIMGTEEEKRLSRFDHRGHREHRVEFARGDYAIPALKKIFAGQGDRLPHEVPGMVGALRGDAGKMQSNFAQLGKRNNYYDQLAKNPEEIQKRLNHLRSYSAKEIRWSRLSPEQRAARLGYAWIP
jgi:hypothetical protein